MKINIIGNIFGIDGYSNHTKGLANALYKIADCRLLGELPQNWMTLVNDAELNMITKEERKEDWNVIVTIPHMWKAFLGHGKNACYCVWEGDKVPESWIEEFINPKVDLILVPSVHTESAIANICNGDNVDIIMNKVKIIPHGIDKSIFYSQRKKDIADAQNVSISEDPKDEQGKITKIEQVPVNLDTYSDIFTFICNKGWRGTSWDRGGVQYLLTAFAEEFNKEEKVKLIIKLNPAYINPQHIEQSINNLKLKENRAAIQIICGKMTQKQLREIYNTADCFVCATRCEAFNIPGLEAMACGLSTIQTSFGGQLEYMNDSNSLYIDYELVESEEKPMYEGTLWAKPLIQSIRKQLRYAFENQNKIKEMGIQAEKDSNNFTWDNSANLIIKEISTI